MNANPKNLGSWFRILVNDDSVWIATAKGVEKDLKIGKVFVGPIDLYATA